MAKSLTNLRSLTRFYATGDSTSTTFSDTETLVSLNGRYQEAFLLATANDGDFEFNGDGSQNINITAGTRAYTLATDLFKISRVEVKYPSSATDYLTARQITSNQDSYLGKDSYVAGTPEFDLLGTKLELFVSAKTADITPVTSGIKVYYQKELTEMTVGGSEIIFPDVFARFLCLGAAADYCMVNGLTSRLSFLNVELQKVEIKLIEYVANRNRAKRNRITFRKEDYNVGEDYGMGMSDKVAF